MEDRQAKPRKRARFNILVLILSGLLLVLTFVVDLRVPLGVAASVFYVAAVFAAFWISRRFRTLLTVLVAGLASGLTVLGYFLSPPGGTVWVVVLNRGLVLLAIWVTAISGLRYAHVRDQLLMLSRRREQRARKQVQVLSGLLPICAHCKDIRNDEGYWQKLEAYIMKHSEAKFSHGLCPKCQLKYFPELFDEDEVFPSPESAGPDPAQQLH